MSNAVIIYRQCNNGTDMSCLPIFELIILKLKGKIGKTWVETMNQKRVLMFCRVVRFPYLHHFYRQTHVQALNTRASTKHTHTHVYKVSCLYFRHYYFSRRVHVHIISGVCVYLCMCFVAFYFNCLAW